MCDPERITLEIILGIILVTGIGLGLVEGNMSRKDWVR